MKRFILTILVVLIPALSYSQNNIGTLTPNPYIPNSISNPYGAGSQFNPNSINNPYGQYGNPYSNKSVNNPFATDAPKLYNQQGQYKGKLSANKFDPDSISNPFGQYGNPYSGNSVTNPYSPDSVVNPMNPGLIIIGQ